MSHHWTPAQQAAKDTRGRTLLVSAAAGSGKTATLTQRIIDRLTDPVEPIRLDRLLVVTFTRAAAAELRERISQKLTEAIAADPGNRHLQKQLLSLGSTHISTIDSFVREPVKAHFDRLGLPAATRIADEAELAPLRERVMGEVMDEMYVKYATARPGEAFSLLQGNPFADLCDSLTSSKNDRDLIPTLLALYERLLSFPSELSRLESEAAILEAEADGDFFDTPHGRVIRTWVDLFCRSAIQTLEDGLDTLTGDEAATKAYAAAFGADLDFCRRLADETTYAGAYGLLSTYQNQRLGTLRHGTPEQVAAKEARTEVVKQIKKLRDTYFLDSPAALRSQVILTAISCRVLYDLLTEYDRRILAEKQARGICDFTDNRRYLLHLLRNEDGSPSALSAELAAEFDEVYIDEYQDVDELQDEIFRLVGGDHRFMVGDIKQSIYGFRGADPSVFARYRRDLPLLDEAPDHDGGNSIFMSDNFRCDEPVVRVTNAVCGHMFRACPQSVAYTDEDDLGYAKQVGDGYRAPVVDVTVLTPPPRSVGNKDEEPDPDKKTAAEYEAMYVANRIASLLREGVMLKENVPLQPKDIVILMRSQKDLPLYMAALSAMGIPNGSDEMDAADAGRDLLHGGDMMYLVNLLRVIDDPDSDIPLAEVLRAPFPGLSLEDVIALRCVGDKTALSQSLYAGVETYAETPGADPTLCRKLAEFRAFLEHYRALCATQSAEGLLRLLRQDSRCACRHTDAFLYLYESARTCRVSTFVSLYTFLGYFEKKLATTKNVAVEKDTEGGRVSIMTIHKSKGLEFEVCFVVQCGKAFNELSQRDDLIFDKGIGVAMKVYRRPDATAPLNGQGYGKIDTTLRAAAALAVKMTEREEEMRVLYVAMTRARRYLYLVGKGDEDSRGFAEGDRFATLSVSNYMGWILAGLKAHPEVAPYYVIHQVDALSVTPEDRLPPRQVQRSATDDPVAATYRAIAETHTEPSQEEVWIRRVPTKVPASRMRKDLLDSCVFYMTDRAPEDGKLPESDTDSWCDAQATEAIRKSLRLMASGDVDEFELLLNENRRPTATEKGTAAHLFLQYCDYGRITPTGSVPLPEQVEEEICRLAEAGFLNQRTADILDRTALAAFFQSRFFARMRTAVECRREVRFNRFIPLSQLTANPDLSAALGDRTLYVQGSIDLLCRFEDGHMEIADYKTDRITPEERADPALLAAHMKERHGNQLTQYAAAMAEVYGEVPTKVYIYSLPLGEAVEINL